jgi:hydroxymethylpyrimidine/phosphomethylpyrimidine kinase
VHIPVKVLCVGGSDSSGGAGIQADLKAVSACGCYGLSVVTAVTAQNSLGVQDIFPVSSGFVARQLESILSDIRTYAVKTGMMLTPGVVRAVAEKIRAYQIEKVVIDPVMMAKGGRSLMSDKARVALVKNLLPFALVVTPNIPEAECLAQTKIGSVKAMKETAVVISGLGAKNVVIKGGHLPASRRAGSIDILYDGSCHYEFHAPWINKKDTHGTGCTFASALAAGLALGENIVTAAEQAKTIVTKAIEQSLCLGQGYGSVNVLRNLH